MKEVSMLRTSVRRDGSVEQVVFKSKLDSYRFKTLSGGWFNKNFLEEFIISRDVTHAPETIAHYTTKTGEAEGTKRACIAEMERLLVEHKNRRKRDLKESIEMLKNFAQAVGGSHE